MTNNVKNLTESNIDTGMRIPTQIKLKKSFSERVSMSSATAILAINNGLPYILPLLQKYIFFAQRKKPQEFCSNWNSFKNLQNAYTMHNTYTIFFSAIQT
jgi:hypothetical protein